MDTFWRDVRDLGATIGVKEETSRKWQTKRFVPPKWHRQLLDAALEQGTDISWNDLLNPPEERRGE